MLAFCFSRTERVEALPPGDAIRYKTAKHFLVYSYGELRSLSRIFIPEM
jgi:hypothetical protein